MKDRLSGIPLEKRASLNETLRMALPEVDAFKDGLGMDIISLSRTFLAAEQTPSCWRVDAAIAHQIRELDSSDLVLVSVGAVHALHCAKLLANDGYKVIYSTTPFLDKAVLVLIMEYYHYMGIYGFSHPVDGSTLKASILHSRAELQKRQKLPGSLYQVRKDLMKLWGLIGTEEPVS